MKNLEIPKNVRFKGFLVVVKGDIMFALLHEVMWGMPPRKIEKYIKETIKLKQKNILFRSFRKFY